MLNHSIKVLVVIILIGCNQLSSVAQLDSLSQHKRENAIKVFIDCNYCDNNNIREELTFLNYVRDVREADVYVLVTYQGTGSGGDQYTFFFIGQKRFTGMNDTLIYSTPPDATNEIIRQGQKQMLKLGFMRYIAKSPLFNAFDINYKKTDDTELVEDKWKSWVFDLSVRAWLNGEESYKSSSYYSSISASKTTLDWKINFYTSLSHYKDSYKMDDTILYTVQRSRYFSHSIVKSLGEHWSAGYWLDMNSSTYMNRDLSFLFAPAIEYDIFPYSESTRKMFTLQYKVGYNYVDYTDTTIYLKTTENLFLQTLSLSLLTKQKWGSISVDLSGSNYFHDFTKNRLNLYSSIRLRIFKGLSFNVSGQFSVIHDQLGLVKGEASAEDILLRQRQLATQYNYYGSVGLSYTFGSIYNNVVNPRFSSQGMYFD